MVHLFTLANVLVRMRYKNKRIFLSFCVFTTISHVPASMYKLLNNLATVLRYKVYKCTRRCSVRDFLFTCSGERYETTHSKPKNKETKTPRTCYFRESHRSPFRNSIRIRPIPRNNRTQANSLIVSHSR